MKNIQKHQTLCGIGLISAKIKEVRHQCSFPKTNGRHSSNKHGNTCAGCQTSLKILSGFPSYTAFLSDCIMSLNQYMPVVPSSKASQLVWVYLERERKRQTLLWNSLLMLTESHTLSENSILRSVCSYSFITAFLMYMYRIPYDVVYSHWEGSAFIPCSSL